MKKRWILLGCTLVWTCSTVVGQTSPDSSPVPAGRTVGKSEIRDLITQARNGCVEAYETLAACYRDGNGLRQSYVNMIAMYERACKRSGLNDDETLHEIFDKVFESLGANHFLSLLLMLVDYQDMDQIPPELVERLRKASPVDMQALDAARASHESGNPKEALRQLKRSASGGSEVACIIQVSLLEQQEDVKGYRKALRHYAKRFPELYIRLGDSYLLDTDISHKWDPSEKRKLRRTVKSYRRADRWGMLLGASANNLLAACSLLESITGGTVCDRTERARLEYLASCE